MHHSVSTSVTSYTELSSFVADVDLRQHQAGRTSVALETCVASTALPSPLLAASCLLYNIHMLFAVQYPHAVTAF